MKQHASAWFYRSVHTVPKAAAFQGLRLDLTPACSHATAAGPVDSNHERLALSVCVHVNPHTSTGGSLQGEPDK